MNSEVHILYVSGASMASHTALREAWTMTLKWSVFMGSPAMEEGLELKDIERLVEPLIPDERSQPDDRLEHGHCLIDAGLFLKPE